MRRSVGSRFGAIMAAAWLAASVEGSAAPNPVPRSGRFEVVTYNVAGLPEGLSRARPVANLPLIGARLNRYDLVLVQEDFAYPELLRARLNLPYQSAAFVRGEALHFGDGLSLFSKYPLGDVKRMAWSSCHGTLGANFDCWTPKGLAFSRLELSPGLFVDVYNVHLDAGSDPGDVEARSAQLQQLAGLISATSADRAVLLGGDFNLTAAERPLLDELAIRLGLADVCERLRCGQSFRLDRLLFRGGAALGLRPRAWQLGPAFVDGRGRALSDHAPVVARFDWFTRAP